MAVTNPIERHPEMMGDGTEEQNLNQVGNPSARITEADVKAAFGVGETHQEVLVDESLKESFPASDSPTPKHIT